MKRFDYAQARKDRQEFMDKVEALPKVESEFAKELARIEDEGLRKAVAAAHAKAPVRTAPLERTVLAGIRKALEAEGCTTHRMTSAFIRGERPMQVGEPGMPDLLVEIGTARPGLMFWLEAKAESGRLSESQKAWHARALARGQFVGVARSADEARLYLQHVMERTRAR